MDKEEVEGMIKAVEYEKNTLRSQRETLKKNKEKVVAEKRKIEQQKRELGKEAKNMLGKAKSTTFSRTCSEKVGVFFTPPPLMFDLNSHSEVNLRLLCLQYLRWRSCMRWSGA